MRKQVHCSSFPLETGRVLLSRPQSRTRSHRTEACASGDDRRLPSCPAMHHPAGTTDTSLNISVRNPAFGRHIFECARSPNVVQGWLWLRRGTAVLQADATRSQNQNPRNLGDRPAVAGGSSPGQGAVLGHHLRLPVPCGLNTVVDTGFHSRRGLSKLGLAAQTWRRV